MCGTRLEAMFSPRRRTAEIIWKNPVLTRWCFIMPESGVEDSAQTI